MTQIGGALEMARSCHTTDAVLDTLFRTAVSAGKEALTQVAVSAVPLSVSYRAVQRLEQVLGNLREKRCLVIGNGNMGRLAASLLVQKGCQTMVTLRSYHRGETVVPFGTVPVSYEQRFSQMEQADIVISATRSPHYTIWKHQLEQVQHRPAMLVDLAMPRDIEASCGTLDGVTLWNLDDLQSDTTPDQQAITALHQIAKQYADTFRTYLCLKDDTHTDFHTAFATEELRATPPTVLCSVSLSITVYTKTRNPAALVFIPICAGRRAGMRISVKTSTTSRGSPNGTANKPARSEPNEREATQLKDPKR